MLLIKAGILLIRACRAADASTLARMVPFSFKILLARVSGGIGCLHIGHFPFFVSFTFLMHPLQNVCEQVRSVVGSSNVLRHIGHCRFLLSLDSRSSSLRLI